VFLTFNGTNVALSQATSATQAACCGQESFRAVNGVMVANRYSSVRAQPLPHFWTVDLGTSRTLTSGNISIYLGQTSTILGTSYSNDNAVWNVLTPKATASGNAGGALVTISICPSAYYCPPELGARVLCPGGHVCPKGISSFANFNCGRGNYCPPGSAAPTPCPYQQPPPEGWGAQQVQGPAFLVETARCLNHCFWNSTSGDSNSKLSTC